MGQAAAVKGRSPDTAQGTPEESQVHAGNQKSVVFQTPVGKFEKCAWKHDSLPPPQGSPFLVSVIFIPRANSNHILTETTHNEGGGQRAAGGGTEAPREGPEQEKCAELAGRKGLIVHCSHWVCVCMGCVWGVLYTCALETAVWPSHPGALCAPGPESSASGLLFGATPETKGWEVGWAAP